MPIDFWRSALRGRIAAKQVVTGVMALALVVGVLTTNTLFSRHAVAAPGQSLTPLTTSLPNGGSQRLMIFSPLNNTFGYRSSDDNGASWPGWSSLANPPSSAFVGAARGRVEQAVLQAVS